MEAEPLALVTGAFTGDERVAPRRMTEAIRKLEGEGYEGQVEVPEDDTWELELQGGGRYPGEIENPRSHWSALARAELVGYPQALSTGARGYSELTN